MAQSVGHPGQAPLPDLPLLREELLVRMQDRKRGGATRAELRELRREYEQLMGRQ